MSAALEPPMPERVLTTGIITEVLTDHTWRARLPNGKEILAFLRPRSARRTLAVGDTTAILMSVEDFSCGEVK